MSISTENTGMYMPVAPAYGGGGFGGDGGWWWLILLFLVFGNGWGGGFGGGFDGAGLYPWLNNSQNINGGFRDQMLMTNISSIGDKITSGFGDVQTALCGGFAGVNATVNGAANSLSQQLNTNQLASLERSFAAQTANTAGLTALQSQLAQCCCDNRAATADLKFTVASENCADRQVVSDGIRDVLAATQAQTQAILDKMCQQEIEAKNDTIAQLRSELLYARGQASQDVQTAAIQAGQRALANEVEQYVLPTPRPAYIVSNPNGCQPVGCGCGVA